MRNYMEFHDREHAVPSYYSMSTRLFGKRSQFIYLTIRVQSPSIPQVFVMDNVYGRIQENGMESLAWLCQREFPDPKTEEEKRTIVRTFLRLHRPEQRVISATADIPGYDKRRLDPDLEPTVSPAFATKDDAQTDAFVVFTYERIGGAVRRYRFPFKKHLGLPACILLGSDIGDALYLQ